MGSIQHRKIKVVILGGGVAGLSLGAGLIKHPHIDVHIYELAKEYQDVGGGLALHLNAINAMSLIGPEVRDAYSSRALLMGEEDVEMSTNVILGHGPNKGEVVAQLGKAKGRRTVHRHKLMQGLSELIPRENITFGKRAASIEQHRDVARVVFRDGEEIEADCIVGADGVHSLTRKHILGENHPALLPKDYDGFASYRRMIPIEEARKYGLGKKWESYVPIICGPKGFINCMPLNKGTLLSINIAIKGLAHGSEKNDNAVPQLDPSRYDDYTEDSKALARCVADDYQEWLATDHDPAPYYWRDRVCMIGDAAHTMYPSAGQGAAQALEDAAVMHHLFSCVTSSSQIPKLFEAYDRIRRPRSQRICEISRQFGRLYNYSEGDLHTDPERFRAFMREAGAFSNGIDLNKQNDDAMKAFEELLAN